MNKLKECFEKGLLKNFEKDKALSKKDLKQAVFFLERASKQLEENNQIEASLMFYNAYFHAVRALLFKEGVKERSHYCVARYFEFNYINKNFIDKKFLSAFETIMGIRHNIQYSTEQIEVEEDLIELTNICEELITKIGALI